MLKKNGKGNSFTAHFDDGAKACQRGDVVEHRGLKWTAVTALAIMGAIVSRIIYCCGE